MIIYIIKFILSSGLLYLAFKLLLEKERMYRFNRAYLLVSLVFSVLVPFISIRTVPVLTDQEIYLSGLNNTISKESGPELLILLTGILYILITLFKAYRLIYNVQAFNKSVKNNASMLYEGCNLVLTDNYVPPHTFLNTIFLSRSDYNDTATRAILLTHELAHAKQRHSLDILFLGLLEVFFWFNPLLPLYKKAIKLNHEFLADDAVLGSYGVVQYQQLLLEKIGQPDKFSLSSCFNYQIARKRFLMMTKHTDTRIAMVKKTILVPLMLCTLLVCCSKDNIEDAVLLGKYENALKKLEESPTTVTNGVAVTGYRRADIKELKERYNSLTDAQRSKIKLPVAILPSTVQAGEGTTTSKIVATNIKAVKRQR